MDNIYDTLAKLNKIANTPKVIKEDSNGMMSKGLEKMIQTSKMNKQKNYTPFSNKQSPDGLPEKKKDNKMFEKESDVERDDRAEKAGREVKRDAKYDRYRHAGKDGKSVTKDIEYDEKHDKDGMHEAQGYDDKEDESLGMRTGKESGKKQSMKGRRDDSYGKFGKRDKEHADGKMHEAAQDGVVEIGPIFGEEGFDPNGTTFKTPFGEITANYSSNSRAYDDFDADDNQLGDICNNMDQHPSFDMSDGINHDNVEDYITMCVKKMSSMNEASKTMVKGPDGKMVPDYAVDGKGKDDMKEGGSLKDAARAGVMARLAELAGLPAQEIEEALGDSPEDTASRIMSEVSLDEEPVEEGNEFSGALATAKKDGKAEFEVDGKKYKVEAMDSDEDAIQEDEGEDGDMPSKAHIEKMCKDGKSKKEICDMHPGCDQGKLKKMIDDCSEHMTEGGGRDMDCATCDGTGKDDDKDCKSCEGSGEAQDDDSMNNESKVEETTSAGSVADGAGSGSSPYKNASVYESNEIVKRARQLNEDMSFTVSGGPDQEPTLNINASGAEAQQLGQLLKLSGLGMTPAAPHYGAMEIEVSEDQEFANSNQNEESADTNTLVNTISGGLNGQKKMAYPRASQGDNAMSTLGESELVATSANQLMKQYQAFKTK